jgi:hypothetical protein
VLGALVGEGERRELKAIWNVDNLGKGANNRNEYRQVLAEITRF